MDTLEAELETVKAQCLRAEALCAETESRLKGFYDVLPYGVFVADGTGRYLEVNAEACRITGYTETELLGMSIPDLLSRDQREAGLAHFQLLLETGRATGEYAFQHRSGERRFWSVNAVRLGENRYLGIAEDISERKKGEIALWESESMFRSITENTFALVSLLDLDGYYIYCNPSYSHTLGYPVEELVGKSSFSVVHPDEQEMAARFMAEKLAAGEQSTYIRLRLICRDGSVKVVDHRAKLLVDPDKRPIKILLLASDVTDLTKSEAEQRRLEEQLRQANKMESVGRLAGGVAHDFNNMLGVILGHAEMALEQIDVSHDLYQDLEEIQKAALRSADLTRQLLAFARKQTINPKIVDLNQTIGGMLKMLKRLVGENVELSWKPAASLWLVFMDPTQMVQILTNLAANARDAIGNAGEWILQTTNIALDEAFCRNNPQCLPGEYVLLSVSDTGCGMNEEMIQHVFEPFFTTKALGKGTGLGLATIYGIVKQNRGFITVYSEPDLGTTFSIYLPRYNKMAVREKSPEKGPLSGGRETILFVEDEDAFLKLGQAILERLGYSVLVAASPQEALITAKEWGRRIDLLVTDVIMPGMNGRQLYEALVLGNPGLLCLFISGYGSDVISRFGVVHDRDEYLQKPFAVQDLADMVRRILDARTER